VDVGRQPSLDTLQQSSRNLIDLFALGSCHTHREPAHVITDGSPNLVVRGISWPEVHGDSARDTWDTPEGRRAKFIAFGHQQAGPGSQIFKKLIQLAVQLMITRDLPTGLLDLRNHIE
jgi:hypothetical protein